MTALPSTRPPNVLILLTDQQRFDALGAHKGLAITPNLDQLVASGIDLRRHFSQCPVCAPSRAVLFSGLYPESTEVGENHQRIDPGKLALFRCFGEAGYRLGYVGKEHLFRQGTVPVFDYWHSGRPDPAHPRFAEAEQLVQASYDALTDRGCHASGCFHDLPDELTTTGVIGERTVRFLEETPADEPFSHVASFFDPHVPHLAPRRFESDYAEAEITPPDCRSDPTAGKHPRLGIKRSVQGTENVSLREKQHYLAVYAAMVSHVDEQIGRILAALAARPDGENTVVVFTSDHGDFGFEHGLCKKDLVLYDALLHVPCAVRLPYGHWGGRVVHALTEHVDIVPTLLELAGLRVGEQIEGESMVPLLLDEMSAPTKDAVFASACPPGYRNPYPDTDSFKVAWRAAQSSPEPHPLKLTAAFNVPGDHCHSVRTADWKFIHFEDGFEELYDLRSDPGELHNLADNPEAAKSLVRLRRLLAEHLAKTWPAPTA